MLGKTFYTLRQAKAYEKKVKLKVFGGGTFTIRKLPKKIYPRRKKRYHVGTYYDWINI